jgi:hypothetical protein
MEGLSKQRIYLRVIFYCIILLILWYITFLTSQQLERKDLNLLYFMSMPAAFGSGRPSHHFPGECNMLCYQHTFNFFQPHPFVVSLLKQKGLWAYTYSTLQLRTIPFSL